MPAEMKPRGNYQGGKKIRDQDEKRKTSFRCGFCQWLSAILTLIFLMLGLAFVILAQSRALSIHSCNIYVPHKLTAMAAIIESLHGYAQRRGWDSLVGDIFALIRSEILDLAPYPQLRDELAGKHLLMVGGARTPTAFARAKQLGLKITLVDDASMESVVKGKVEAFVPISNFGHVSVRQPETITQEVIDAVTKCQRSSMACPPGNYDGVFTLVEDHGPLVSYIAEKLGLTASPVEASTIARNKYEVRRAMDRKKLKIPRFAIIEKEEGLSQAASTVGFPAFLKPVYGVQATFAAKVPDMEELVSTYRRFQGQIDEKHHPIYNYGKQMILEQLLGGPEVQLEMMLKDGKVCVTSTLSGDEKEQLLVAATDMLEAVGLTQGVVHLELFLDAQLGAQVIEVNNRLSRGFLPQRFAHQLGFGEHTTDYYGSVFALALSKSPAFIYRDGAPINLAMFLDLPSTDWWKTDPKDAPNRGWEAEGECAVFFGASPQAAWEAGKDFQKNHLRTFKRSAVDKDDFIILLVLWGAAFTSFRLFFVRW